MKKKLSNEDQKIIYDLVEQFNSAMNVLELELGTPARTLKNTQVSGVLFVDINPKVHVEITFQVVRKTEQ